MKLNVLIIKKKTLIILGVCLVVLSSSIIFLSKNKFSSDIEAIPTMSKPQDNSHIKLDLNGDGKEDVLYITSKENKYYIEANILDKSYFFNEKKPLNTLGQYNESWPISLEFLDLSRDKLPEIIIRSSENDTPIQHIFSWGNNEFNDIFCSTNNILGFIDSTNNKTPKFISFSITDKISEIQQYMVIGKNIKNISYEKYSVPGLDPVNSLIDLIQLPYEISDTPDIFSSNISSSELSILWRLDKANFNYALEDGFFKDTDWNDKGDIINCTWNLRFKKLCKNESNKNSSFCLNIDLESVDDKFIIKSIRVA